MTLKKILHIFDKICFYVDRLVRVLLVIIFLSVLGALIYQIIGRYFFRARTGWVNEYIGYCLALITFWGASCLVRQNDNITIEFFSKNFPQKIKKAVRIIGLILTIYYMSLYVVYGNVFAEAGRGLYSATRTFEMYYPRFIALVVGSSLIILQAFNLLLAGIFLDKKIVKNQTYEKINESQNKN